MNLWLPSPWIAPSFGRTDHSPLQTARESFDLKQLSSDLDRNMALPWPFTVQCLVTRATGDQGLPAVRSHTLHPQGFLLAAWLVQVRKPADVVHFTLLLRAAELTRLRQEPLHDCTAMSVHLLGLLVEGAMTVPAEAYAAKPGDQRIFSIRWGVARMCSKRHQG